MYLRDILPYSRHNEIINAFKRGLCLNREGLRLFAASVRLLRLTICLVESEKGPKLQGGRDGVLMVLDSFVYRHFSCFLVWIYFVLWNCAIFAFAVILPIFFFICCIFTCSWSYFVCFCVSWPLFSRVLLSFCLFSCLLDFSDFFAIFC